MKSTAEPRQQQIVTRLLDLIQSREAAVESFERERQERADVIRGTFATRRQAMNRELVLRQDALEADYQARKLAVREAMEREVAAVTEEAADKLAEAERGSKSAAGDAEYDWFLAKQRLQKEYEADQRQLRDEYRIAKDKLKQHGNRYRALVNHAKAVFWRHRWTLKVDGGDLIEEPNDTEHLEQHLRLADEMQQQVDRFRRLFWVRFVEERWCLIVFFVASVSLLFPWYWGIGNLVIAGLAAMVAAGVVSFIAWYAGRSLAAKSASQFADSLVETIVAGKHELLAAQARNKLQRDLRSRRLHARTSERANQLDTEWQSTAEALRGQHERRQAEIRSWAAKRHAALAQQRAAQDDALALHFEPQLMDVREQLRTSHEALTREEAEDMSRLHAAYEARCTALVQDWRNGVQQAIAEVDEMRERCSAARIDYEATNVDTWEPPQVVCDAIAFGRLRVDLREVPHRLPEDTRFSLEGTQLDFPVALDLYASPSLMIETGELGGPLAAATLRAVMLRMLTSLPPGKVRLTIVDPVGLGENFAAFMHLADHDEQLVNHRIWTEASHINARLTELTAHMENVIQTYLRNEFRCIQDYNRHAGEVAEPFRVLVVANFPAGFSEDAARRLRSIVSSGPRCGVYTLLSVDTKQVMPKGFDLDDLRAEMNVLAADHGQLRFAAPPLAQFPIALDAVPEESTINRLLHTVGRQAQAANRVEVPFAAVALPPEQWWQADSRSEIAVPLGRAGATKLQLLRLGLGTSQHVLISGKTGSGKSTLLHALITNLALKYSPEQVQFYLIDFKKGVEFKAYAEHELPHARVVAIESEREFGQSVLQRLDVELRRRGDLFRRARVQSLAGYRDARPDEPLPRILLVIDEFQEFFVKEDKIAQEASLLLDRLVRQGRAFGIHVLLGSQTLAGAYSLARATIGQMAVRVALQCSATDAHLILSDDNDAARLLRRPGEAIYNDANGLIEGNHPFQVVWLSDVEREHYLRDLAAKQQVSERRWDPPLVFEGNVAANVARNEPLVKTWEAPAPVDIPLAPRAWLGEAIAIKEAPAAVFHRRSGGNLVIVGQQEDSALGMMASSLLSLAAFSPGRASQKTRFVVLDGARPETIEAGYWTRFADTSNLGVEVLKPKEALPVLDDIYHEVQRRMTEDDDERRAVFLFIYNLSRFRGLQKSEDDFGFGSFAEAKQASAAEQLACILREGPARGVHTLLWCDTYTNLTRWLDRQSLRDMESRVLFQMSATDSSNLMDSSAAAQLGPHRAIFYSEDQGIAERFRPYGLPQDEFLLRVRALAAGAKRGAGAIG